MEEARQCSRSGFLFSDIQPWRLCYPQNHSARWRVIGYVVYKWIAFLYFLAFILYSGIADQNWYNEDYQRVTWFIYLTNWTFIVFVIQLLYNAICASLTLSHPKDKKEWEAQMVNSQPPWYLKLNWILYEISGTANLVISILYWALLYSPGKSVVDADTWNSHGANAVFSVLIDMWVTAMPVRVLHLWLPIVYAATWTLFSAVYELAGGTNSRGEGYIYSILDWTEDPGTAGIYAAAALGGALVGFLVIFGLYNLRILFYKKRCSTKDVKVHSNDEEAYV